MWVIDNSEWLFSGVGLAVVAGIFRFILRRGNEAQESVSNFSNNQINPSQVVSINMANNMPVENAELKIEELKQSTNILFIDDDKSFKIVGILKNMGWTRTKLIGDVSSLGDPSIIDAKILFIDIQGIGKKLQFKDEGLGLALAIKRRYLNEKKVIIYSANEDGKRFHEALSEADYSLTKNADPVRFEDAIIRVLSK